MSRISLVIALLAAVCLERPGRAEAAPAAGPAPIFAPMLANLSHASIPVYLPAWMPAYRQRIYHTGGVDQGGRAYFVSLSTKANTADASLVFWMTAQRGPGNNQGRRVTIGQGFTAFLDLHAGGNEGPTVIWRQSSIGYTIGGMATTRQLLRAARSIVRVH